MLLLTAANSGYLEMLTNWESMVEGGVFLLTFHFQVVIVYFRAHTVIIIFPTQMAKKWGGQKNEHTHIYILYYIIYYILYIIYYILYYILYIIYYILYIVYYIIFYVLYIIYYILLLLLLLL